MKKKKKETVPKESLVLTFKHDENKKDLVRESFLILSLS